MKEYTVPVKYMQFYRDEAVSPTTVILLSGRAGVGKSTTASILKTLLYRRNIIANVVSFAQEVKNCASQFFNWDEKKDDRGRKLLQSIGNIGREYDEDNWVKLLVEEQILPTVFSPDVLIVDDWRFPNEYEYIKNNTKCLVIKVKIEAPEREALKNTEFYNDISEISLSEFQDYDYVINNSGSEDELYYSVLDFVNKYFYKENKN